MRNPAAIPRLPTAALALLLAAAVPLTGVAQAQVFKYTDANGQVHFSDRAPSNATQIKGPTPPTQQQQQPAAPARPAAPPAAAQPEPTLPVSDAQAQQVQRDMANARVEQCKQAKENYDKAIRAQRVYRTNDKGEREYISAAEADQMRLQIKAEMDGACG